MERAKDFDLEPETEAGLGLVKDDEGFDPSPIDLLTIEHIEAFDLYTQGYTMDEIALRRQAAKKEVKEVINSVPAILQSDRATATLVLLKEGLLKPTPQEAEAADEASIRLAVVSRELLGAFVIAGTYEEAGRMLDYSAEEARDMVELAAIDMRADYNTSQIMRLAYAARLDEYYRRRQELLKELTVLPEPVYELDPDAEDDDELEPAKLEVTEEPPTKEFELPPVAITNIQSYFAWMYPRENVDEIIAAMDDAKLAQLSDSIRVAIQQYISTLKPLGKRKAVKPAAEYADRWMIGMSIPSIAGAMGKNEGTVALSLQPFAEKVGKSLNFDELLALSEKQTDR